MAENDGKSKSAESDGLNLRKLTLEPKHVFFENPKTLLIKG